MGSIVSRLLKKVCIHSFYFKTSLELFVFEVSILPNTYLILHNQRMHKNGDVFCIWKGSHLCLYFELLEKIHTVCTNLCLLLTIGAILCHCIVMSLMVYFWLNLQSMSESVMLSRMLAVTLQPHYISLNAHHTRILIDFFPRAGEKYLKSAIVSKRLEQSIGNWLSLSCLFGSWSSFVFEMGSKLQEKLSILQVCKVVISTMYINFYKCLSIQFSSVELKVNRLYEILQQIKIIQE